MRNDLVDLLTALAGRKWNASVAGRLIVFNLIGVGFAAGGVVRRFEARSKQTGAVAETLKVVVTKESA